jgi:hypothetical protein
MISHRHELTIACQNQRLLWSETAKATVVSNGMPFVLESGLFLPECVAFSGDEAYLLMEKETWEIREGDWIAEDEQNEMLNLEFGNWIANDENGIPNIMSPITNVPKSFFHSYY